METMQLVGSETFQIKISEALKTAQNELTYLESIRIPSQSDKLSSMKRADVLTDLAVLESDDIGVGKRISMLDTAGQLYGLAKSKPQAVHVARLINGIVTTFDEESINSLPAHLRTYEDTLNSFDRSFLLRDRRARNRSDIGKLLLGRPIRI